MRVAVLAGVAAGTLIALQTAIISSFGERLPAFVVATWVHVGGLAFALGAIVLTRTSLQAAVVRAAPWGLLAGVAGVLLITGIAVAVGGLGLASTLALVTAVQLLVGFGLESSGLVGRTVALDPVRLGGAALIVIGVYAVVGRGPAAV
jgi:bacterial/archaeal transporter family-2 protein